MARSPGRVLFGRSNTILSSTCHDLLSYHTHCLPYASLHLDSSLHGLRLCLFRSLSGPWCPGWYPHTARAPRVSAEGTPLPTRRVARGEILQSVETRSQLQKEKQSYFLVLLRQLQSRCKSTQPGSCQDGACYSPQQTRPSEAEDAVRTVQTRGSSFSLSLCSWSSRRPFLFLEPPSSTSPAPNPMPGPQSGTFSSTRKRPTQH